MASALRLDTLKFAKRLTDAGLTREAAEAIVEGLNEADLSELATKADFIDLKSEITELRLAAKSDVAEVKSEINALRLEVKSEIAALRQDAKSDIAEVKSEIRTSAAEMRADLYKGLWIMGLGIVGLTVALIKFLP